jgi:hypothetical protein
VRRLVLVLALVAACGGGTTKATPAPPTNTAVSSAPPASDRCDQLAEGTTREMQAQLPRDASEDMRKQMVELVGKVAAVIARRCREDGWSDALFACMDEAKDPKKCKHLLTAAQRQALDDDMRELLQLGE